ncbi:MAG: hypothetical protein Unbinned5081contig1003_11 [Prokaryotic dsDNA virus sp.]|nr:MAG: hypothetical protein Unbinned5081contig1003_11 [Prokaryotic dsDNA virus sp.]|tara:strand:- start:10156 stop:12309 length:2154 start_codon:yes stop_codon:yes gene_type:complete
MSALISPQIKKQYFDNNGDPLSGGKLYVYEAGTTTPATSYTEEDAVTPNANPIILDSRGEVGGLFLNAGSYKFVLDDSSDNTIWTEDNITLRDVGSELDTLSATVTAINTSITAEVETNRLVSGAKSSNSSQSKFLTPVGSSNQVTLLAATTNLVYIIGGTQYTQAADLVGSGLASPPLTNNTALINNASLSDQYFTKTLGEFETVIPYDTAGSEITSLDGKLAAFKVVGTGTEYFIARVDNTNSCLKEAKRGYFFDSSNNAIERVGFSDNDTLTLMKLSWLYLTTTGSMLVSDTEPTYSSTEPASPSSGDMWYDMTNEKWKRFNSTTFEDANAIFIGICIQDENGNTVGARSADFFADFANTNSFECQYQDATSIRSLSRGNSINVYGSPLKFSESYLEWSIVSDLEDGVTEAASTFYYAYIKENGDKVLSPTPPYDKRGDRRGYYHSYETWRYVAKVFNNGSSNFLDTSVESSPENDGNINNQEVSTDSTISPSTKLVKADSSSGDLSLTIEPANIHKGKSFYILKTSSSNKVSLSDGSYSRDMIFNNEILKLISDGDAWKEAPYSQPLRIAQFWDQKTNGTPGGGFDSGAYRIRDLNMSSGDFGSLDSNVFTLPPGRYFISVTAPAYLVAHHKLRLYDVDTSSAIKYGPTAYARPSQNETHAFLNHYLNIATETDYRIEHRCNTTRTTDGMGLAAGFGDNEIFTEVIVYQLEAY